MVRQRRRFGAWELHTSHPACLVCKPYEGKGAYHVRLDECQSQEGYDKWLRHLSQDKVGFDVPGFERAIQILREEGEYLKPL